MAGLKFAGKCYFNRKYADGTRSGLLAVDNATQVQITPKGKREDRISREPGTYGQILDSATMVEPAEFSWQMDGIDHSALAIVLQGQATAYEVTGGTATAETLTFSSMGGHRVARGRITAVTTLTNAGASVTYDDYTTEPVLGLVIPTPGGDLALAIAASLAETPSSPLATKVTYTYPSATGYTITGAVEAEVTGSMLVYLENQVDGRTGVLEIDEVVVQASAAFDAVAEKLQTASLKGIMRTLAGATEPFRVRWDALSTE